MQNEMTTKMNTILNELGISGSCERAECHRNLAFFDVCLAKKKGMLRRLESSAKEIALALQTQTVPIMKLIPKLGVVRLQVALSEDVTPIDLRDLMTNETVDLNKLIFPFLLGEDDEGNKFWMDMNSNPHLLIAGTTGSGKSTILHSLIANALYLHAMNARDIFIYLVDPKRVEFNEYRDNCLDGIVKNIVNTYTETYDMFKGLEQMMEDRYSEMSTIGMKTVEEDPNKFPLTMCIVDEVADLLMEDSSGRLQNLIIKIAQKGRAAGIFITLATQRPSTDVITGVLKANFPGRIACATASMQDSQVILDRPGAETLLGRGDAIYKKSEYSVRFQAAYTTPKETIKNFNQFVAFANRQSA